MGVVTRRKRIDCQEFCNWSRRHILISLCPVADVRLAVVVRNRALEAVFDTHEGQSERDRNVIWRLFTYPGRKDAHWEEIAQLCLAQFRAEYGRFVGDPWWPQLIAELSEVSAEFRDLWARLDVPSVLEGRKSIDHPRVGELTFEFLWLQEVKSTWPVFCWRLTVF